jgi:hypothetical protein
MNIAIYNITDNISPPKLDQPPDEWIIAAKAKLCEYLQQTHFFEEVALEWIGVYAIEKYIFNESQLGIHHGTHYPQFDGFQISLQYKTQKFLANVALHNQLHVHFPCLQQFEKAVPGEMILKVIEGAAHQLDRDIDPKSVKVLKSHRCGEDCLYNEKLQSLPSIICGGVIETFKVELRIINQIFSFIFAPGGKIARNLMRTEFKEFDSGKAMEPNRKKKRNNGGRWEDLELLNGGKPFDIDKCPRRIIAIAKKLIGQEGLKLDSQEEINCIFTHFEIKIPERDEQIRGWYLRFISEKSEHKVYIDSQGKNALLAVE